MAWGHNWDTDFGNNPEDTESRKYGAQQIRNLKDAIVERMQVDHEFGEEIITSGTDDQNDTGYHKRVTLITSADVAKPATTGHCALAAYRTGDETSLKMHDFDDDTAHTIVTLAQEQTLTNKTLSAPVLTSVAGPVSVGSGITGLFPAGIARIDADGSNADYEGLITGITLDDAGNAIYKVTFAAQTAAKVVILAIGSGDRVICNVTTRATTYVKIATSTYNTKTTTELNVVMFVLTTT